MLHGLPTLASKGYVFEGLHHTSYVVEYTENPDCLSHYVLEQIVHLPQTSAQMTMDELFRRAKHDLHSDEVTIDFSRDIIHSLVCPKCSTETECFVPVGAISFAEGRCPIDGEMRIVQTLSGFHGQPQLAAARSINSAFPPSISSPHAPPSQKSPTASPATPPLSWALSPAPVEVTL